MTTRLEERFGSRLIKAGPEGNGRGDRGFMDRRSYILTKGSGTGRDCLEVVGNSGPEGNTFCSPQSPTYGIDIITAGLQALYFASMSLDGIFRVAFSSQSCPVVMTAQISIRVTGKEIGMGEVKVSDDR